MASLSHSPPEPHVVLLVSKMASRFLLFGHLGRCIIPQLFPWDVGSTDMEENDAELVIKNLDNGHSVNVELTLKNFLNILVPQFPLLCTEG